MHRAATPTRACRAAAGVAWLGIAERNGRCTYGARRGAHDRGHRAGDEDGASARMVRARESARGRHEGEGSAREERRGGESSPAAYRQMLPGPASRRRSLESLTDRGRGEEDVPYRTESKLAGHLKRRRRTRATGKQRSGELSRVHTRAALWYGRPPSSSGTNSARSCDH